MFYLSVLSLGLAIGLVFRIHTLIAVSAAFVVVIAVAIALGAAHWTALLSGIAILQLAYAAGSLLRNYASQIVVSRLQAPAAER